MRLSALALLEIESVAAGIRTADVMVKRAPISLLRTGTVHPGRSLILIGGTVASVEEAWQTGCTEAGRFLRDAVFLPDAHQELTAAVQGERRALEQESLGVLETDGVAALLRATDAAVKGAEVHIGEIRLADDLGGHAFVLLDGALNEVEAALEIASDRIEHERILHQTILPRIDENLRGLLIAGTRFAACEEHRPEGAELS